MDCEQVLEHPILAEQISAWGRSTSRMRTDLQLSNGRASGLVDVLDRALDMGRVLAGDVKISLAEVVLLSIRTHRLEVAMVRAQGNGRDWVRHEFNRTSV